MLTASDAMRSLFTGNRITQSQLMRPMLTSAGFYSFKYADFAGALGYFKSALVDPRQVLALVPSIIPSTVDAATVQSLRRTLLDNYGLSKVEDIGMSPVLDLSGCLVSAGRQQSIGLLSHAFAVPQWTRRLPSGQAPWRPRRSK